MTEGTSQKKTRRASLRLIIISSFVALAVITTVFATVPSVIITISRDRANVEEQLDALAQVYEQVLNDRTREFVRNITNEEILEPSLMPLLTLNPDTNNVNYNSAKIYFGVLADQIAQDFEYDYMVLVNSSGKGIISGNDIFTGHDFSSEQWFQTALNNTTPGDSSLKIYGPSFDPNTQITDLYFSVPVFIEDRIGGFLMVAFPSAVLTEIAQVLPVPGETGEFFMVAEGQRYTIPPTEDRYALTATDEIVPTLLEGESGSGTWIDYSGQEVFGVYRWLDDLNMGLVIKQDTDEAFSGAGQILITNLIVGVVALALIIPLSVLVVRQVLPPLQKLRTAATQIVAGNYDVALTEVGRSEIDDVIYAFNRMITRNQSILSEQETIINARTRELKATSQIGRMIAAETNLDRLLTISVNLIADRLGYYHAQVFMLDDLREFAVLKASTGDAGRQLLELGHRLPVGSRSVIGQVSVKGEPVLAADTTAAANWVSNPLLPLTRAECAVPLIINNVIVGALDVQATEPDAFGEETISTMQTIADQIAIAIHNADLMQESERLLSESQRLTNILSQENWEDYIKEKRQETIGYRYDLSDVKPLLSEEQGEYGLSIPIEVRGQQIGRLLSSLPGEESFTDEQKQMVNRVLERVATAVENARMFEQTQVALSRSNSLYRASQAISDSNNTQDLTDAIFSIILDSMPGINSIGEIFILDDPNQTAGNRWVKPMVLWSADHTKKPEYPELINTNSPLLGSLEDVPEDGLIINDLDADTSLTRRERDQLLQTGAKSTFFIPLGIATQVFGWIRLFSENRNAYLDEDVKFLQSLTDQATTSLANLFLLQDAEESVANLQNSTLVNQISSAITGPDSLTGVVDAIRDLYGYYHAQVFLIDDQKQYANLVASTGEPGQMLLEMGHKLGVGSQSIIGRVTSTGKPALASDTMFADTWLPNPILPETRAEMAVPLRLGTEIVGALDLQSKETNAFDDEIIAIMQSLADQIALSLENARLFNQTQKALEQTDRLYQATQMFTTSTSTDQLYGHLLALAMTLTDKAAFSHAEVYEIQNRTAPRGRRWVKVVNHFAIYPEKAFDFPDFVESESPIHLNLEDTPPAGTIIQDVPTSPLLTAEQKEDLAQHDVASIVTIPLIIGGNAVAWIRARASSKDGVLADQVQTFRTILDQATTSLANLFLLKDAEERAANLQNSSVVNQISSAIKDTGSLAEVVDAIRDLYGYYHAQIFLIDDQTQYANLVASTGEPGQMLLEMGHKLAVGSRSIIGRVTSTGKPALASDTEFADTWLPNPILPETRAEMAVPLRLGTEIIGALDLQSNETNAFDEDIIAIMQSLADQIALSLQNARLFDQTQKALNQTNQLYVASQTIADAQSINDLADRLFTLTAGGVTETPVTHGEFYLLEDPKLPRGSRWARVVKNWSRVEDAEIDLPPLVNTDSEIMLAIEDTPADGLVVNDVEEAEWLSERQKQILYNEGIQSYATFPLGVGDQVHAWVRLRSIEINAFTTSDRQFYKTIADQVATVLASLELIEQSQMRAQRLQNANEVSQVASSLLEPGVLLPRIVDKICEVFGYYHAQVFLVDDTGKNADLAASTGEPGRRLLAMKHHLGVGSKSVIGQVTLSGRAVMASDTMQAEDWMPNPILPYTRAELAVPLRLGEQIIGALDVQSTEPNAFDIETQSILQSLADQLAVTLRNAELFEQTQESLTEMNRLYEASRVLFEANDAASLFSSMAQVSRLESVDKIEVIVRSDTGQVSNQTTVNIPSVWSRDARHLHQYPDTININSAELLNVYTTEAGGTMIDDVSKTVLLSPEQKQRLEHEGLQAMLTVPAIMGGLTLGWFRLYSKSVEPFGQNDIRYIRTVVDQATTVYASISLLDEINAAYAELQELDNLKSQFLANMSHELRTPLNSIIGFSRVLLKGLDGELNEMQSQDLATIHESGKHLLGLINEILDMSKINAGKMEIQPEYIDMGECIDESVKMSEGLLETKPVRLVTEIQDRLPAVYADPVRIRQVLLNLISNACKFTSEGSITVKVFFNEKDPLLDVSTVEVNVIDTGIGIASEDIGTMFEAFRQVDGSTTRQAGGTGLGLPIAKEFIEMHGGRLWVESTVGVGSNFRFTVPVKNIADTEEIVEIQDSSASPAPIQIPDGGKPIILAVDDEPGVLVLYNRFLEKAGFGMIGLKNADTLTEYIHQVKPAALILDLNLPGKNGWDAIREIQGDEEIAGLPIIICSIDDQRTVSEQMGIRNYLLKPVFEEELVNTLRSIVPESGD